MRFYLNSELNQEFRGWYPRIGNALLCRLEGINLSYYGRGMPEVLPVYMPLIDLEVHPGQFIVHFMLWKETGFHVAFLSVAPFIKFGRSGSMQEEDNA